jgi:predicted phosphodiesterase
MKVVIVSDTHNRHEDLGVLRGDVLIHCGDNGIGFERETGEVERLDDWFGRQDFQRILCIGGNHDFQMQERDCRQAGFPQRHLPAGRRHFIRGPEFLRCAVDTRIDGLGVLPSPRVNA